MPRDNVKHITRYKSISYIEAYVFVLSDDKQGDYSDVLTIVNLKKNIFLYIALNARDNNII